MLLVRVVGGKGGRFIGDCRIIIWHALVLARVVPATTRGFIKAKEKPYMNLLMCSTSIQTKTSTSVLISPSFGCSTNFSDHVLSWSSLPARRADRTPSSARRRTSSAVHGRSAHGPAAYCRHYPTAQARWHRWRCPGWSFWSVLATPTCPSNQDWVVKVMFPSFHVCWRGNDSLLVSSVSPILVSRLVLPHSHSSSSSPLPSFLPSHLSSPSSHPSFSFPIPFPSLSPSPSLFLSPSHPLPPSPSPSSSIILRPRTTGHMMMMMMILHGRPTKIR